MTMLMFFHHTVNNQFFPPLIFLNIFSQFKMIENDLDQSNLPMPLHYCGKQDDAQWARKFKKVQTKKTREIK